VSWRTIRGRKVKIRGRRRSRLSRTSNGGCGRRYIFGSTRTREECLERERARAEKRESKAQLNAIRAESKARAKAYRSIGKERAKAEHIRILRESESQMAGGE
jgi:hypothetical protein